MNSIWKNKQNKTKAKRAGGMAQVVVFASQV
jgi:hypothetical protein